MSANYVCRHSLPSTPWTSSRIRTKSVRSIRTAPDVIIEPFRERLGSLGASIGVGSTETTEGSYVGVSLTNPLAAAAAYNDTFTAVDINGQPGWLGSGSGNYVMWEPVPGTYATVGGTNSPDESIALARSVQFVDRATWQTFYDVANPNF